MVSKYDVLIVEKGQHNEMNLTKIRSPNSKIVKAMKYLKNQ